MNMRYAGKKQYELSNHLGNVLAVVSDRKKPINVIEMDNVGAGNGDYVQNAYTNDFTAQASGLYDAVTGTDGYIDYYEPDVISYTSYYAFGSTQPNISGSSSYSFGFNGKEKQVEIFNNDEAYDFGARMYDSRLGRWFSLDYIEKPDYSPYAGFSNNPIIYVDSDGNDDFYYLKSYKKSDKIILKDGPYEHKVPIYDLRKKNNHPNRYFYKIGTNKFIPEGNEYKTDKNGNVVVNYKISPKYIQINSPVTIKGGDKKGVTGFSSLSDNMFYYEADQIINAYKKTINPNTPYMYSNLKKLKNAAQHGAALDFKYQLGLNPMTLYKSSEDIYYNSNEMGNYFFGYALAALNYNYADAKFIAEEGTSRLSGGKREYDEPWELDAILDGWNYYMNKRDQGGRITENIDMYRGVNVGKAKKVLNKAKNDADKKYGKNRKRVRVKF